MLKEVASAAKLVVEKLGPQAESLALTAVAAESKFGLKAMEEISTERLRTIARGFDLERERNWATSAKSVIDAVGEKTSGAVEKMQLLDGIRSLRGEGGTRALELYVRFDQIAETVGQSSAQRITGAMVDKYALLSVDGPINYGSKLAEAKELLLDHRPQFIDLSTSLKDGIQSQRWSTIIGDDVSGRIPAKIVWEQARLFGAETGQPAPNLLFLASGTGGRYIGKPFSASENAERLASRIEQSRTILGQGRTLVVTECMGSGNSMDRICNAIKSRGLKFDVAAMQKIDQDYSRTKFPSFRGDVQFYGTEDGSKLYSGGAGSKHPLRLVTGIEKYGSEAHSRTSETPPEIVSEFGKHMNIFARDLYETVIAKKP